MHQMKLHNKHSTKIVNLVLASQSVGRRDVLKDANIAFIVDPAHIDESKFQNASIEQLVEILAYEKAKVVAKRHQSGIILAADTMVFCNGEIIGKATDQDDALKIMTMLSGTTHQVYTGVAIIDLATKKFIQTHVTTNVTFRDLTANEINEYLTTGEYIGKAGAYSAQLRKNNFISKIEGSITNVVGLPLERLLEIFSEWEYELN